MLQVNISGEWEKALNDLVPGDEKAKIDFVMRALAEALDDAEDARDGDEAYAEWVASGKKTYTWQEVAKECGL